MSASGNDGESETNDGSIVVREEGVEVIKSHEIERFPVPAIVFSIRSEREERIEIRLTDRVPEGASMDDIGFHPEYGSEFWSVEGRTLVFERELEGEGEIETVYGLRGPEAETADRFLGDPTIEVWTGGESDSSFVKDINDQLTRSATFADNGENGEDGWVTEADESSEDGEIDEQDDISEPVDVGVVEGGIEGDERESGEDGERSDSDDRGEDDVTATEDASMDENTSNDVEVHETSTANEDAIGGSETDAGTDPDESVGSTTEAVGVDEAAAGGATTDAIAARLARELRTGNVDAEDREILRDVLGPRESVSARIEHLRSQVNDVAAYADALEAFLDNNGSGRTLIRQQTERLDALREDTETVTERAGANRADLEAIEGDVATVERDVDAFQTAISDLDEEIERIDERFASIDERFETVNERVGSLDERLDALESSHESEMADLREEMETRIDERVADVERTTEDIETDVESLEAWRAQLAGALGAAGDTGATESEGTETGNE